MTLTNQRIEIFRYGFENEQTGYLMDDNHIGNEFEDIEICPVDDN